MRRSILLPILLAALPLAAAQDVGSAVATAIVDISSVAESVSSSTAASGSSGSTGAIGGADMTSTAAESASDSSMMMTAASTAAAGSSASETVAAATTSSGNLAPLITAMPGVAVGGLLGLGMFAMAAL